jgi:hypothetical protein
MTILCLLFAYNLYALEFFVEIREYGGIERRDEPVVISGDRILRLSGTENIDTRRIVVSDEAGKPVPAQIDERDGEEYFQSSPNHTLDPNDEISWQVSLMPLEKHTYRISTTPGTVPKPSETDLKICPNPQPNRYSADIVMRNSHIEMGIRGWPADKSRWSGIGSGNITMFKLFGDDQIFQGEGHSFILNNNNIFDALYDSIEVIAEGPVRGILQLRGSTFSGRKQGFWGRSFYDVKNGHPVRNYILYNKIPLLETSEYISGEYVLPRLTAVIRFLWRPGGTPFNKDSTLLLPDKKGSIETITLNDKDYGKITVHPKESWVAVTRPDKTGVPAFFFQPEKIAKLYGSLIEPWMKKGFDERGYERGKSIIDIDIYTADADKKSGGSWRWYLWGAHSKNPVDIQRQYRALVKYPLSDGIKMYTGKANVVDMLHMPPDAVKDLSAALREAKKEKADLERFSRLYEKENPETIRKLKEGINTEYNKIESLLDAFKNWDKTDYKNRYHTINLYKEWQEHIPPQELWYQQFELFREDKGKKGYCVMITDIYEKVFRNLRSPGSLEADVELYMARREGESIQIAVIPVMEPLKNVKVTGSSLKNGNGGMIDEDAWSIYEVRDITPPGGINETYGKPEGTRWPDPLFPLDRFNCSPDELVPVLATLYIPDGTEPGTYRGSITVSPEGKEETAISVEVYVFNFTLPEKRTMFWDSWYCHDKAARHYGRDYAINFDIYRDNMELLSKYRTVPGIYGWAYTGSHWFQVWQEADGSLTFDFSEINRWIELSQKYGNLWNPNLSCNSGVFSIFHSKNLRNVVKNRQTGKVLTLDDLPEKSIINPEYTLIYEKFMLAWVENLKKQGWLKNAWHEKWDEPVRERIEPCKKHHAYLKHLVPELHIFNWGMRPVTDNWGWELVDAWAPNLSSWYEELPGIKKAQDEGLKIFLYTCGAGYPVPDRTIMRPDINIWDVNIQRRVYGWMYHWLQLDGFLIFTMNGWPDANRIRGTEKGWPDAEWITEGRNTHWLVWPAPEGKILPSLRLDALRDGFEDYEYLYAAERLRENAKNDSAELNELLSLESIITSTEVYLQDSKVYNERKKQLGRYLEKHLTF